MKITRRRLYPQRFGGKIQSVFKRRSRFTGNPDSVVTAHNGEALAKLIKFVAVTSSQIGSRSMRLAETEDDFKTKQQSAAEQIREFAESDEINADIEAGW